MNKATITVRETADAKLSFYVELVSGSYKAETEAPFRSSSAAVQWSRNLFSALGVACFSLVQVNLNGTSCNLN